MNINFPIEEAVKKRYSVRNYSNQNVEEDKRLAIRSFINSINQLKRGHPTSISGW